MKTKKRQTIRMVAALAVTVVAAFATEAAPAQTCYATNYQQAESLYKKGNYSAAIKRFRAARACPDKPAGNDLEARIRDCEQRISAQNTAGRQRTQQRTGTTGSTTSGTSNQRVTTTPTVNKSFTIKSVEFRNEDIDDNVLDDFGSTLCAADICYLMPRITYDGPSQARKITLYYKIFNPDGTMRSSSTSPAGYTNSDEVTLNPGTGNVVSFGGWGSSSPGSYEAGRYRFEAWVDGKKVFQQSFTLAGGTNSDTIYLTVDLKDAVSSTYDAEGGTETFYVRTNSSSWDLWGVPSWCTVTSRDNDSFTIRCEPNTSGAERSDYMKVMAGGREVRLDFTQAGGSSAAFNGEIEDVTVDYDQWEDGRKGMIIHLKFTIGNMMNREAHAVAYFFYEDSEEALTDYNNDYRTVGGQVCLSKLFTPKYANTRFSDLQMFMPYDELHLSSGTTRLKFYVLIYDEETQEDIVRSDYVHFTFTAN